MLRLYLYISGRSYFASAKKIWKTAQIGKFWNFLEPANNEEKKNFKKWVYGQGWVILRRLGTVYPILIQKNSKRTAFLGFGRRTKLPWSISFLLNIEIRWNCNSYSSVIIILLHFRWCISCMCLKTLKNGSNQLFFLFFGWK